MHKPEPNPDDMINVNVRMPRAWVAILDARANRATGRTRSVIVREILEQWIKKHQPVNPE